MPQKQTRGSNKVPTQNNAKPEKSDSLEIDVDDAMIDDQHPKDTIRGGPPGVDFRAGKKRPGSA
jgi:hypothetical protein